MTNSCGSSTLIIKNINISLLLYICRQIDKQIDRQIDIRQIHIQIIQFVQIDGKNRQIIQFVQINRKNRQINGCKLQDFQLIISCHWTFLSQTNSQYCQVPGGPPKKSFCFNNFCMYWKLIVLNFCFYLFVCKISTYCIRKAWLVADKTRMNRQKPSTSTHEILSLVAIVKLDF